MKLRSIKLLKLIQLMQGLYLCEQIHVTTQWHASTNPYDLRIYGCEAYSSAWAYHKKGKFVPVLN
jgi:hypothetical protein